MEMDRLRSNTILEGSSFLNRNENENKNKNEIQNHIERESRERGSLNRSDSRDNSNNEGDMKINKSYNSYSRIQSPQTSNIFSDEKVRDFFFNILEDQTIFFYFLLYMISLYFLPYIILFLLVYMYHFNSISFHIISFLRTLI